MDNKNYNYELKGDTLIRKIIKVNGTEENVIYEKIECFGKGGFGICYKYKNNQTGEVIIVKELEKKEISFSEVGIHNNLKNQNIVKLIDTFGYNCKFYLLLECCENRDLSSLLKKRKKLKEVEVQYYIIKLIEALKY